MTWLRKVCFLQATEQRLEVRIRIYCHSRQRQRYGKPLKGVLLQDQKKTMCFVVINILQKDLCVFHHEAETMNLHPGWRVSRKAPQSHGAGSGLVGRVDKSNV